VASVSSAGSGSLAHADARRRSPTTERAPTIDFDDVFIVDLLL
jgi:hypothetical protein